MNRAELATLFRLERARFVAAGFPRARRAFLELTEAPCPAPPCRARDYACAEVTSGRITLAERALALPAANVRALLRHELGHVVDPTPRAPGAEARADRIAELVGGSPIRYDRRGVQTLGRGGPRPSFLPR
jgi:hypothetical protein